MLKKLLKRTAILGIIYGTLVLGFYLLQPFFVFQGTALDKSHAYSFNEEIPAIEYFLPVAGEVELNLLHFPTNQERRGTVLFFHGNADNLERWGKRHMEFTARGYDVWMYDYRGFGKSGGKPGDAVFYSDARKVFDYVQEKYPNEELVFYGQSLGTAVASQLATQVNCDSLILVAPFTNLDDLFQTKFPWLWQPFSAQYDFAVDSHLDEGIDSPIHIIHGTRDFVIPWTNSIFLKELFEAKDSYEKIDGAGHKNFYEFAPFQAILSEKLGLSHAEHLNYMQGRKSI